MSTETRQTTAFSFISYVEKDNEHENFPQISQVLFSPVLETEGRSEQGEGNGQERAPCSPQTHDAGVDGASCGLRHLLRGPTTEQQGQKVGS